MHLLVDSAFESTAANLQRRCDAVGGCRAPRADVGNLVDNSPAHGAGPIMLFAVESETAVESHVADGGEGFPAFCRAPLTVQPCR
ncbi:MAG: hypothetical protein QOH95_2583 [Gaiellaceae bacterium]|nr:hypothetical protein [Gaiellaceae bacterium]